MKVANNKFIVMFIALSMLSPWTPSYAKNGHYTSGSSHKGEHYRNASTGNHYTKH